MHRRDRRQRTLGTSRSTGRVPLVDNRVPKAKGKLWTTGDLDLRVEPREKSKIVGLLKTDKHVAVTGRRQGAYAEVIVNKETRWVTAEYLSKKKKPDRDGPERRSPARTAPRSSPRCSPRP